MDYKTNLVLHISFSLFFLLLVHCLYSIVFLISFMDFLINKLYLVSCIFKIFRFSMHILTIKYLKIYKYYDVILFDDKEKSTSFLLKFLSFIICK